jgi:hypothetical protein
MTPDQDATKTLHMSSVRDRSRLRRVSPSFGVKCTEKNISREVGNIH